MLCKMNLKKIAADALDMSLTPDNVTSLAKHDAQYHPNGYEEGQFCKFRQALERGDSVDNLDAAEKEEADTNAELARLIKRLEDLGRIVSRFPEEDEEYDQILSDYGFKKSDADYQDALKAVWRKCNDWEQHGDESSYDIFELKSRVLALDEELTKMRQPKKVAPVAPSKPNAPKPKSSNQKAAAKKQDINDLYLIREYLEKCARLLNGRAGNVAAIQSSGRWPLLQDVSGGKLGKEIGDRLDEMANGGDAAVVKAVGLLKPVYDKIVQSSKSGWTIKPGMIIGEEDLFDDD